MRVRTGRCSCGKLISSLDLELGFTMSIGGVVLLQNGMAIVMDMGSIRSVQPNLRAVVGELHVNIVVDT